jgi:hypothetical protein
MAYRGPYSASLTPTAVTTTVDLFHITVATDNPVTLIGFELYNTSATGDTNERMLSIAMARGVTGGTGGTGLTEVHFGDGGGSAPTATVVGLNTTVSTAGTVMAHMGWNVRVPFFWFPIPEIRPSLDASQDPLAIRLLAAPAASTTIGGCVYWYEG